MIHARPNLNGNSPDDFKRHALAINAACDKVAEVLRDAQAELFNGRNYQTVEDDLARAKDITALAKAAVAISDIKNLSIEIFKAGELE